MASKSIEPANGGVELPEPATPTPATAKTVMPGVRLESLGRGVSYADVHERTRQVVIRRSGRLVERLSNDESIHQFATDHKLSALDRETLSELAGARGYEAAKREVLFATLGPDAKAQFVNTLSVEGKDSNVDRDRVKDQVQRNDEEVFAWVERQRLIRQRNKPSELKEVRSAEPTRAARDVEQKTNGVAEPILQLADRNARVPAEVESQFTRAGQKFYHLTGTKSVAFVDRGDKLETPSSAPKLAEALVKIADGRDWNDLRVRGTEGFRREVWIEASIRGIHVDGYQPSELDKAELQKRHTLMQGRNAIEARSETFKKRAPEAGVLRDPTLAAAYGAEAAAKRFAERLPAESREAFVNSVKEAVAHKLDKGEPVAIKLRVPEGQLIEHGQANYQFDRDEKPSYYVKLAEANGRERIYWGAGLQQAMTAVAAQPGDTVQLRVTESKGVVVPANVRDAAGVVVERQMVDAQRNEWQASVTAKTPSKSREIDEPQQERVRVR